MDRGGRRNRPPPTRINDVTSLGALDRREIVADELGEPLPQRVLAASRAKVARSLQKPVTAERSLLGERGNARVMERCAGVGPVFAVP